MFWNFHFEKKALSIKTRACIAHTKDVTHISCNKNYIITASEDTTVIAWNGKTAAYISPITLTSMCSSIPVSDYVVQAIMISHFCIALTFFGNLLVLYTPSLQLAKGSIINVGQGSFISANGLTIAVANHRGESKVYEFNEDKESLNLVATHNIAMIENDQIIGVVSIQKRNVYMVYSAGGMCMLLSYTNGVIGQIGKDWPFGEIMKPGVSYIDTVGKHVAHELNPESVKDHAHLAHLLEKANPNIGRRYTLIKPEEACD